MMTIDISWNDLHDATLLSIEMRWRDGEVAVRLRTVMQTVTQVTIRGTSARRLECPRSYPWGASVSVNEIRGPDRVPGTEFDRIEIEMQSGDVIVFEAAGLRLEDGWS